MEDNNVPVLSKKEAGGDKKQTGESLSISWHPAFVEAIQLELEDYRDSLEFISEFQLTSEPLRIDCVIIKKIRDVMITKNIGSIFREVNLLEYKNPEDYVSVEDFYKVYAYACLYVSLEKVPITRLSISFVESRFPRELLLHLEKVRGYRVEESSPGIYTVEGDILPIQIIDSRKLSVRENLWLKGLDNRLKLPEIRRVEIELRNLAKDVRIKAYLEAIMRANKDVFKEALKMGNTVPTMDEVLEELGFVARWEARGEEKGEARGEVKGEARGEERKAIDIAKNMINQGFSVDTISSLTGLEKGKVEALYKD